MIQRPGEPQAGTEEENVERAGEEGRQLGEVDEAQSVRGGPAPLPSPS